MDFSLQTLTAAIIELPHRPTQLGDSGLFAYQGVATLTVDIEKQGNTLSIVPTSARGAPGQAIGRKSRNIRTLRIPHIKLEDAVLADEVQGVRSFGTTDQPEPLDRRVNEVLQLGVNRFDYTLEYHRMGAVKGIVYDADGSELFNFFNEFGVAQNTLNFALDNAATEVRSKCDESSDLVAEELGGVVSNGSIGWCGKAFWRALITHKSVKETFLNQAQASELRGAMPDSFDFGGTTWVRYRGAVAGVPMVADDEAYIVPTGVDDLLLGRFGPANYNDTVNTIGLPSYAKGIPKRDDTGWDIQMQTNPIHINTRPRAVIKATRTA